MIFLNFYISYLKTVVLIIPFHDRENGLKMTWGSNVITYGNINYAGTSILTIFQITDRQIPGQGHIILTPYTLVMSFQAVRDPGPWSRVMISQQSPEMKKKKGIRTAGSPTGARVARTVHSITHFMAPCLPSKHGQFTSTPDEVVL